MFKKKDKKKEVDKELEKAIQESKYYDTAYIKECISVVNNALVNKQLMCKYGTHDPCLVVISKGCSLIEEDYVMVSRYSWYPLLNAMEIKGRDAIEKERRDEKQKELEKLRECQAKDLEKIEQLARELGSK